MEKSVTEQDREIRDIVKRAEKNLDRTGAFRRETLNRLIDLTHSHHSTLKCFAAGHIRLFFKDFPDLEEEAINAVYDLCEDQVSKVRIEGYSAIVQVSREQKKWVKRNADVLVQLLQSDEPDEVGFVKKALLEHLDMDPPVTLGVLCDQIVPPDEPMDDEEQQIRDRLRSLVISFLTGEAKRAILRHASRTGSEAEAVLVNELLGTIPNLSNSEIQNIVKDLLLSLPSYTVLSPQGHRLLQVLLEKAKGSLRDDTRSGAPSLKTTRFFLDLASFIAVEKQVASPADLLRFNCQCLGKMTLSGLPQDDYVYFIQSTAQALAASEDINRKRPDSINNTQLASLRGQVVTASPNLINLLVQSKFPSSQSWRACETILQACLHKKSEAGWSVPTNLTSSLRDIEGLGEKQAEGEIKVAIDNVQKLIRLLAPISVTSDPLATDANSSGKSNGASASRQQAEMRTHSLPPRPTTDNPPPRRLAAPTRPRAERTEASPIPPASGIAIRGAQNATLAGPSTTSNKRDNAAEDSPRSTKKARKSAGNADGPPSLLSRLAATNGSSTQPAAFVPSNRHVDNKQSVAPVARHNEMDLDEVPAGGFSIRGAANRNEESNTMPVSRSSSSSLLDRMKGVDMSPGSDRGSYRKRKRGRT